VGGARSSLRKKGASRFVCKRFKGIGRMRHVSVGERIILNGFQETCVMKIRTGLTSASKGSNIWLF